MKDYLRRLRPSAINDLIAMNALYRPGALKAGMVDVYVACKNGEKSVKYIVPELEPILSETFGVIVYQEQVMQIAVEIAGYTMAKADLLRKAMGKKKAEMMQEEKEEFIRGAKAMGFKERDARAIFELIEPFAGYGFNKSHSVSYAVLAYITAWLKVHYSPYFMARLIGNEISDTEKMVKYIRSSEAMGLKIHPPDINASRVEFSVEGGEIRFGFEGIKGVGESAASAIVEARGGEPFSGIGDLLGRLDGGLVNKKVLEALIKSGAFDSLHPSRSALFSNLENLMGLGQKRRAEQQAKQSSLFAQAEIASAESLSDPDPWPDRKKLAFEKQAIGFYFSGHPLADYSHLIHLFTDAPLSDLAHWNGRTVRVAGVITALQMLVSKGGANPNRPYARFELEDETARTRAVAFPRAYAQLADGMEEDAVVLVKGRITVSENGPEISVDDLFPLADAPKHEASGLMIRLTPAVDEAKIQELHALLRAHSGPLPVQFTVIREGAYRVQLKPALPLLVRGGDALIGEIEAMLGANSVYYLF